MSTIATILVFTYGIFCLLLLAIWLTWKNYYPTGFSKTNHKISLIIPVRNESKNIIRLLTDLQNQTLAQSDFEVIVANDDSTDNTAELVAHFQNQNSLDLKLINLPPKAVNTSPKKRAITHCIKKATGSVIVCTDGDCTVSAKWLSTIKSYFEENEVVFLSAPVFFLDSTSSNTVQRLWTKIQQIEFASLIVSGAVSIKMNFPNMCSGANIAYIKEAFFEVNGFEGNEDLASGDDEFLMHKITKAFPKKVHYLKSKDAIVKTEALHDLQSFYNQRKRWAGKWSKYTLLSPKVMAIFIFSANAAFVYALLSFDVQNIGFKMLPEFLFLGSLFFFFKKPSLLLYIPIVQIIYPFYVLLFGLVSLNKKSYTWKDRKLS
ncbi:glycosyltransferase [Arcticibacterium luteifluviistationis]|uniref:glycosyltransferase n=1 Tax=Arcticibacterium luteifluviistationis TaxID=1784714 RepID=UPI0013A6CD3B|nr:glycosyltransferase [Arcticibacterium luteifluviistationis]